jgi:small subunit ribosomal protein S13
MRIAGITIPEQKRLEIGLTEVYGIGRVLAHRILTEAKVEFGAKPKELSTEQEAKINEIVSSF